MAAAGQVTRRARFTNRLAGYAASTLMILITLVWTYWGAGEMYLLRRLVVKSLPTIHQPLLIFQGRRDAQLTPDAPQIVYDGVASTDKTVVWLERSGHNLLVDGEREDVWARSYAWMMDRVGT